LAFSVKSVLGEEAALHPILVGCLVLPLYGAVYFGGTAYLGIAEARATLGKLTRQLGVR
jgi:hypothetical protein